MPARPAKHKPIASRQICEQIPAFPMPKIARKHDVKTRSITPWNHVAARLYAQFTHALELDDVCDTLAGQPAGSGRHLKEPSLPIRNGLSNANRTRDPAIVGSRERTLKC